MSSPAQSPDFIRFIVETYKDDPNGYRRDILGMADCDWQDRAGESVRDNKRTSVSSGHGIGKTGFSAATIHWFIATRPHPAIVATANTEAQLRDKLWRELAKVNAKAKNREWFDWKQSTFTMFNDPTAQAVALAWSEHNPEAFAGTHEEHVLGVFDESSAVARVIFNVFNGAMTTPGARWLAVGNPTRNEGYFYDITHGKLVARKPGDLQRGLWNAFVIPSWESPFVDPAWVEDMANQYGRDSDEFRVRVGGLPPRFDSEQFFQPELITNAQARTIPMFERWPLILGCDVGRGDRSVIFPRRGRKALDGVRIFNELRTTDFARTLREEVKVYREEYGLEAQLVIEELGMGVGVVETLQDMGLAENTWGINTGEAARQPELYINLRCEMYGEAKRWLEDNVELPNVPELIDDLMKIKRKPSSNGKLRLETKDEMRRRGLKSPDVGDAFALTFAMDFDLLPEKRDAWGEAWKRQSASGGGATWMSA